jgi:murein DD-endopeptidase MepM/ murein hydrolase activator NlpD
MKRIFISFALLLCLIPLPFTSASPLVTAPAAASPLSPARFQFDERSQVEQAIEDALNDSRNDLLVAELYKTDIEKLELSQDSQWATAWLVPQDPMTGQAIQTEPGLAVVQKRGDEWVAVLPDNPSWITAVQSAPDGLLSPQQKSDWLDMYGESSSIAEAGPFKGYMLPFAAGTRLVLTRSILHNNPPDPAKDMHYAFDFAAYYDSSGSSPMFPIYAAKAGTVKYAVWQNPNGNEKYANYVVLEDTTTVPTTYQVYFHLAQDSIPNALRTRGTAVLQGQYIGLADDTGISTGNHLHFQVHTNPNSYWGKAVDITFEDVLINGGRPRTVAEARYFSQFGAQGQTDYISGNKVRVAPTPPAGDIAEPENGITLTGLSLHLKGWALDDDSFIRSAQFIAKYNGEWHSLGTPTGAPQTRLDFEMDWDLCADGVPDGPISLALRLSDYAGSQTYDLPGLRHFIKNFTCPFPPPPCEPTPDQAALYASPDYRGDCQVFNTGDFSLPAALNGLGEDSTASIKLGANIQASLWANSNKTGRSQTFFASDSNLSDNWIGAGTVSSLRVQTKNSAPLPPILTWPSNGALFSAGAVLNLAWQDGGGDAAYQVKLNGTNILDWLSEPVLHLDSLTPGIYKWQVRARNLSNTLTSNWSMERTFTISSASVPASISITNYPYLEGMESNAPGWAASSGWTLATDYNHTTGEDEGKSYQYSYNLDGSTSSGDLTSPPLVIPAGSSYFLRFWYLYQTESSGKHWDQRWIQISEDGGPFKNVLQLYDDPADTWLQSPAIPLSGYAGETIQARFHFDTLDGSYNTYKGWYVDDFSITADPPPTCSDSHEPNDSTLQAAVFDSFNTSLSAAICSGGDVDFYQFNGKAGDRIGASVDAQDSGSKLDSRLYLLDSDGASILAAGEDQIPHQRFDASLTYILPRDGIYYLKVLARDHPSVGGNDSSYNLRLIKEQDFPSAQFVYPASGSLLPETQFKISISASDASSGISHVEFFWHSTDWQNSDWEKIGEDWDGKDGWSIPMDLSNLPYEKGLAAYAKIYDWAGNETNIGAWNLTKSFSLFFPVLQEK